jgi:hypothetical protein
MDSAFIHVLLQTAVIGAFGGAGLVLTQLYSRRGPLIYPVYAAILFVLALSLTRATGLGFASRFLAALVGMLISTTIAMVGTVARSHPGLLESGRPLAPGRIPSWAAPLLLLLLSTVSAAAAYVSM